MINKKIFHTLLISAILLSDFSLPLNIYAADFDNSVALENLTDVKRKHWAYPAIERIVEELQIMSPKTPTKFMGDDISTRYEVAEAFFLAAKKLEIISGLELKVKSGKKNITVSDVDDSKKQLIESVVNEYGLMQVLPGNKFLGNKKISRYELAYELDNYLNLLEKVVAKVNRPNSNRMEKFTDVKTGHWATNSIKNIVNKYQIMKGYPDNQFKGNNTLTRYELVAVLKKFVDYIDRYLIPIPKYIPTVAPTVEPTPIPIVTPMPTPIPIITPVPIPNVKPIPDSRTPLAPFDGKLGFEMKASYTGQSTNNEIDTLSGPTLQITYWFPKFSDMRLGATVNGSLLNYGKLLTQYHSVNNLRRNTFGIEGNLRFLGVDYADDPSLYVGLGYELLQWGGANYDYSNNGPTARAVFEMPIGSYFSIIAENKFHYMIGKKENFNEQLQWKNDLFLGVNVLALSQFSFQIGYKDTRFSLGKSDIFGDIGGIASLRFRY